MWLGAKVVSLLCLAIGAGNPLVITGSLSRHLSFLRNLAGCLHNMVGLRVQKSDSPVLQGLLRALEPTPITLATHTYHFGHILVKAGHQVASPGSGHGRAIEIGSPLDDMNGDFPVQRGMASRRHDSPDGARQRVNYQHNLPQVGSDPPHLCFPLDPRLMGQ